MIEWVLRRGVGVGTTGFVLSLSWLSSVTAGHTKKVTTNAIMLSAYCIGNSAGPFMWQAQYKPRSATFSTPPLVDLLAHSRALACRNHVPWLIIGLCYVICPLLMLLIRYLLARENKKRDTEPHDVTFDEVYIQVANADGKLVERRIDKVRLSLGNEFRIG